MDNLHPALSGNLVAAFVLLGSIVPVWSKGTPSQMRDNAARDDGGRVLLLAVSTIVSPSSWSPAA